MNIILSVTLTILITLPLVPLATLVSMVILIPLAFLLDTVKLKNEIFLRYISRWVISFLCWGVFSFLIESFSLNSRAVSFTFLYIWGFMLYSYLKIQTNRYFLFEVLKGDLRKYNIHTFFIILFSILTYYSWNFLVLYFILNYI